MNLKLDCKYNLDRRINVAPGVKKNLRIKKKIVIQSLKLVFSPSDIFSYEIDALMCILFTKSLMHVFFLLFFNGKTKCTLFRKPVTSAYHLKFHFGEN